MSYEQHRAYTSLVWMLSTFDMCVCFLKNIIQTFFIQQKVSITFSKLKIYLLIAKTVVLNTQMEKNMISMFWNGMIFIYMYGNKLLP